MGSCFGFRIIGYDSAKKSTTLHVFSLGDDTLVVTR